MSYYLIADGKLLGVVSEDQRQGLALDHLLGIEFIPLAGQVETCVKDLRPQSTGGGSCLSSAR